MNFQFKTEQIAVPTQAAIEAKAKFNALPFEHREHYIEVVKAELSTHLSFYLDWQAIQVMHGKSSAKLAKMQPPD